MAFDTLLLGAKVIDGTGTPAFRADVGLEGDRITAVGELADAEALSSLDCTGKTIAPGFIDIHSHADWALPRTDHGALLEPFVRQGITSIVAGNCGFSPAPTTELNREHAAGESRFLVHGGLELRWESIPDFLDSLEATGIVVNLAQLAGHGAIRGAVMGPLNPARPTTDELHRMETLAREALDAGCAGISTGLAYVPGIFALEDELATVAGWVAREDKLFTSHLKAYSWISPAFTTDPTQESHNLKAIREIVRVGQAANARVQLSHLIFFGRATWPTYADALRLIEEAKTGGLDIAFDAFTYTGGNAPCPVFFPSSALPRLEEMLNDPAERRSLGDFVALAFAAIGYGWEDIRISWSNTPLFEQYEGLVITEAARRAGEDPWDFFCRLTLESRRLASIVIQAVSGDAENEEPLRAVLRHPLCTIETDAPLRSSGYQSPNAHGAFPRALSTYVQAGLFTLEEAVHKMTGAAAERLKWRDRGSVRTGCTADLVVFDAARLQDRATFETPNRFPTGIEHVFINGRHVLDGDRYDADMRAGRVLRS